MKRDATYNSLVGICNACQQMPKESLRLYVLEIG